MMRLVGPSSFLPRLTPLPMLLLVLVHTHPTHTEASKGQGQGKAKGKGRTSLQTGHRWLEMERARRVRSRPWTLHHVGSCDWMTDLAG